MVSFYIWEIFRLKTKIQKFKILEYSEPSFHNEFDANILNDNFCLRRRVQ